MSRLIRAESCQLVVVDVQQRLVPAMADPSGLLKACTLLVEAASILQMPVTISEQYPAGLGHTLPEVAERAGAARVLAKTEFSILANPALRDAIDGHAGRRQLVVVGVEAHVCVLQSVLDAVDAGFQVFVAADAVASRRDADKRVGLERMASAGAVPVTAEMVVFEALRTSTSPHFRALSRLVR